MPCKHIVVSVNVTLLTKDRLFEILNFANRNHACIIALQETKHPDGGFPFANRLLALHGWSVQWSESPCKTSFYGGTALIWRKAIGRGKPVRSDDHRICARTWPHVRVASIYGPASAANLPWFSKVLEHFSVESTPTFLVGDFNWKTTYEQLLGLDWKVTEHVPCVIGSPAAPTRVVHNSQELHRPRLVEALPGIPHHCATLWQLPALQFNALALRRLRRCAVFEPIRKPTPEQCVMLESFAKEIWNSESPDDVNFVCHDQLEPEQLNLSFHKWHVCVERFFERTCDAQFCARSVRPERAKGSPPSSKAWATSKGFHNDSIAVRRCKRLHRAAVEQAKVEPEGPLTQSQVKHWLAAVNDKFVASIIFEVPHSQSAAIATASKAIKFLCDSDEESQNASWKQIFRQWNHETIKAAKEVLKPDLNPPPVSAQELFDDWQASFSPPQDIDRGAAWLNAAHEAQLEARNPAEDFVTWEDFLAAAESAKGSPGLDGWTSAEFRFLARSCPWLLRKLFDILRCIVLKSDSIDSNQCPSIFLLFTWKLCGNSKKGF